MRIHQILSPEIRDKIPDVSFVCLIRLSLVPEAPDQAMLRPESVKSLAQFLEQSDWPENAALLLTPHGNLELGWAEGGYDCGIEFKDVDSVESWKFEV
jgi:hypothetical protein